MATIMRFAPRVTLLFALGLAGCGNKPEPASDKPAGPPATLITATVARRAALDITEDTLGTLEALIDPSIGAEVAGRVTRVVAHSGDKVRRGQLLAELDASDFAIQTRVDGAEIARLEALVAQAERFAERQQDPSPKASSRAMAPKTAWPSGMPCAPSWPPPGHGKVLPKTISGAPGSWRRWMASSKPRSSPPATM